MFDEPAASIAFGIFVVVDEPDAFDASGALDVCVVCDEPDAFDASGEMFISAEGISMVGMEIVIVCELPSPSKTSGSGRSYPYLIGGATGCTLSQ